MDKKEGMAQVEPVRLGAENSLQFECHKGLSCFTKCCRGINIILTPYDIIRMKNRLQLSSEQFLAIYTKPELLEKTALPTPMQKPAVFATTTFIAILKKFYGLREIMNKQRLSKTFARQIYW